MIFPLYKEVAISGLSALNATVSLLFMVFSLFFNLFITLFKGVLYKFFIFVILQESFLKNVRKM
jgi:hypothetical protein